MSYSEPVRFLDLGFLRLAPLFDLDRVARKAPRTHFQRTTGDHTAVHRRAPILGYFQKL